MTENAPAMPGEPIEDEGPDLDRRRMLTTTTAAVGAVGVALTAVPFIESLEPSETAQALGSPVTIDISKLAPGEMTSVEWRQKPVWVLHRTDEQLGGAATAGGGPWAASGTSIHRRSILIPIMLPIRSMTPTW